MAALITAGLAVPVLLLLYFLKLRMREQLVSSTFLWKKAIQDLQVNAPFQRLRRNLLLLLQLLLLLLILLALARPVLNISAAARDVSVILIDRSASMSATDGEGGQSRLNEAKARAKALVDTLGQDATAMVIAFDDSAETVQLFTSDRVQLKGKIDSITGTDRRSRLEKAFALAEAQALAPIPEQLRPNSKKPDVYLFSDGRALDRKEAVLHTADLRYERIGKLDTKNVAIVALQAKRNYERPTQVQVFARFANYGIEPVENADVLLSVDGQVQQVSQKLILLPERWTDQQREAWGRETGKLARVSVDFTLDLPAASVIRVENRPAAGDALAADDFAQIVIPPPRSLSVLLVSDSNPYLSKLMELMKLRNYTRLAPAGFEELMDDPQKVATDYDVVIFDRYTPKQLPPTGNFVWFGALPPNTKLKPAMENGKPIMLKEVGVLDWKRSHPILHNLNMQRLYVGEMMRVETPPSAEVIVTGTQTTGADIPMIFKYSEGRSTHVVIAFDLLLSNLPLRQLFPPFMDNLMRYMTMGAEMDLKQSTLPGATPIIPRLNLQQAGVAEEFRLNGPMGSIKVSVPASGDVVLPALNKVGLYTSQPPIPQFEKIAVNLLDDNESNLQPEDKPVVAAETTSVGVGGKSATELWWWILACAAVPLCMVEWLIYTRRMHL